VDFVRQYLGIEEVRFPDRLRPIFDLAPGLETAAVPEFILQPLVENAVRHGLARRMEATQLGIAARREGDQLVLTVTDDGPGPGAGQEERAGGVGLSNARERLRTLYGDRARLTLSATPTGGATAEVRLPYRDLAAGPGGAGG
jgi:LytS/YehU family sensor histidine kinase